LTALNTYKRQISINSAGLEPTIPASELLPTYTLDRAAAGMAILHSLSTT